eukprot:m.81178 g.81178  ORF g.81178 m.81178 type:complete len:53 (-) comp8643_c0_seq1:1032-1190(-)
MELDGDAVPLPPPLPPLFTIIHHRFVLVIHPECLPIPLLEQLLHSYVLFSPL